MARTKKEQVEYKRLKAEVSKMAQMMNKRIDRLEKNNMTNLSAYRNWKDYGGGVRFSVANKDYNELQQELSRVTKMANNKTSLVRENAKILKKDYARLNLPKGATTQEMNNQLSLFYQAFSKTEQYLKNVQQRGASIGYNQLQQIISSFIQNENAMLDDTNLNMEYIIQEVGKQLDLQKKDEIEIDDELNPWNLV